MTRPRTDAGFPPPTEIAGRVRVHGRGGTVLSPGIDLLHRADDFPPTAPILVITDGWCDPLRVRRGHAYLIPQGNRLPFTARGRCSGRDEAERGRNVIGWGPTPWGTGPS